jgi:hypothetical protein
VTACGNGPVAGGSVAPAACERAPTNARNLGFIIGRRAGLIDADQSGITAPPR